MAKTPTFDTIMAAEKLKPLLALSKKEPVQAAMGLTAEGDGVLLLDKKAAPRKVMSLLRSNAEKGKLKLVGASLRFGRAEVDVEYDPGVVRLFVNKEPPGALRMKLTEVVKRMAYQKVEFTVDPSLEEEHESEGGEAQPAEAAAAAPDDAPPTPPAPAPDAATLTQQLRALIGRIPQATATDPARKDELTKLAMQAGSDLKAANLEAAAEALAQLRSALDAGSAGETPDAPAPQIASDKLLALFRDAKDDVDEGLNKLQQALRETGEEDLLRIADYGLYGMVDGGGVGLMKALFDLQGSTPATREQLMKAARTAAETYRAAVFSDPTIDLVDDNPFGVTVGIKARLGSALDAIAHAA